MDRGSGIAGRLALAAIGAHGLVVQVVLMRELMAAHGGNELSAGLALGVWVLAESLGALAGGRAASRGRTMAAVLPVAAVVAAGATLAVPMTRTLLGLRAGEQAGPAGLLLACVVVAALPAFCHGGLFVLGSGRLASGDERRLGTGYVWEGIGTVLAGLLVWLVLLESVPAGSLVAGAGLLMMLAGLPLAAGEWRGPARVAAVALGVAAGVGLGALALCGRQLERAAWQQAWPGQVVVSVRNSRVGKVLRLERAGQRTVVRDAAVAWREPPADRLGNEELALVPLLACPAARRVLVCGPGFELAPALLGRPVKEVLVVEPDPVLVSEILAAAGSAADWTRDPRLTIAIDDPRRVLNRPGPGWDVVIVPQDAPVSLAGSRFFSEEFYRLCRQRLNPGGLLAMPGPGSPGPGLPVTRELLRTRRSGLGRAFPAVRLVMLDFPLFLAGDSAPELDPALLGARLDRSPGSALDSSYLAALLDPFRQTSAGADSLSRGGASRPGTDIRPRELFLNLARAARAGSGTRGGWYEAVGRLPTSALVVALAGLFAVALVLAGLARRRGAGWPARFGLPVLTTGFAGAGLTVLGIFVYQVRFGSVYSAVSLLVTAFMAGTVIGGWLGNQVARRRFAPRLFTVAEIALAFAGLLLVPLAAGGAGALFAAVMLLAGAAVGCQFPLAAAARAGRAGARLGLVAGLDLAGGALGAFLVAALFVPAWGLAAAVIAVALLKTASLVGRLAAGQGD